VRQPHAERRRRDQPASTRRRGTVDTAARNRVGTEGRPQDRGTPDRAAQIPVRPAGRQRYRGHIAEPVHIPEDVRIAVLSRLEDYGVKAVVLGQEFLKREGYGSFEDYIDRVRGLYGDEEADRVRVRMGELAARDVKTVGGSHEYRQRLLAQNLPRYALMAGPDAEFLKGIDYAMDIINTVYGQSGGMEAFHAGEEVRARIAELFAQKSRVNAMQYRGHVIACFNASPSGATRRHCPLSTHLPSQTPRGGAWTAFPVVSLALRYFVSLIVRLTTRVLPAASTMLTVIVAVIFLPFLAALLIFLSAALDALLVPFGLSFSVVL
jgi:hypothetical protein